MKIILRILFFLVLLFAANTAEAGTGCCAEKEIEKEKMSCCAGQGQDDAPCQDDACHCVCCGSATLMIFAKTQNNSFVTEEIQTPEFIYQSPQSFYFLASIWQPPKLG